MQKPHFSKMVDVPRGATPGAEVRSLLRSRWVQGLMAVTAAVTVAGAAAEVRTSESAAAVAETALLPAMPASVASEQHEGEQRSSAVTEAWSARAVERESQRLAAAYVQRGYRVSPQLAQDIHAAALKHDIDPEVAFGLVRAESSFRNNATSPVGATGLTQLMPRTAAWIEPGTTRSDLRDPKKNLDVGFKYLRYLIDKYDGDTRLALLAYNRGPGTVNKALKRGRNPDNGYADFVMGKDNHGHTLYSRNRGR